MAAEQFSISVKDGFANLRLDIFLSQARSELSRSSAQKLIESKKVLVNGVKAKPSYKVRAGDLIVVTKELSLPLKAFPEDIPLNVIYEDESLIVVNKPQNMVVHAAAGNYSGTLVNALLHHCADLSGIGGVMRPGIVHRLDKGTSGVIVAAKDDETHVSLSDQFKNRSITKKYLALIYGYMPSESGALLSEIGRDIKHRKKISSHTSRKKEALTFYKTLKKRDGVSLLELTPKTGRTHQLRVQLSEAGHPIVGDELYGAKTKARLIKNEQLKEVVSKLDHFLLHALYIKFFHPKKKVDVEFFAELPDDFAEALRILDLEPR